MQKPFKLLRLNGPNEGLADFGECHPIKRITLNGFVAHQPMEERAGSTRIGLNRSFGSWLAVVPGCLAEVDKPGTNIGSINLSDQRDPPFTFQETA